MTELDIDSIKRLFNKLFAAYSDLKRENPEIGLLKKKIRALGKELNGVKVLDRLDRRRLRRMEMRLDVHRFKLEELEKRRDNSAGLAKKA
jgi:hypothetical protein